MPGGILRRFAHIPSHAGKLHRIVVYDDGANRNVSSTTSVFRRDECPAYPDLLIFLHAASVSQFCAT
jgi:hypothetical protein